MAARRTPDAPAADTAGPDAEDAAPAAASRQDVAAAYRAFLGRTPESETVIANNLRRTPVEIARILAASQEFANRLRDLLAGRLTPHAALPAEALEEAFRWAADLGLLPPDAMAGEGPASPAVLLAGLAGAEAVRAEMARLPPDLRESLAALDPSRTALHCLTRPAEAEDARCLGLLLGQEAVMPRPGASLGEVLRQALARPGAGEALLRPLAQRQLPDPPEAEACARFLHGRLGLGDAAGGGVFLGALLAAFLRLPVVVEALARAAPADHAAADTTTLTDLETGALLLKERKVLGPDVGLAYLAVLGRAAESAAVARAHEGASLGQLLATLIGSAEFRAQILGRLAADKAIPHHALPIEQRREVDGWLAGRLGLYVAPARGGPAATPLHGMALLARLTALPALARELRARHGELWADARAALDAWLAESARGLAGGIDYVTGDWIAGWAMDRRDPATPLEVEIHCNGELVAFGRADRPRLAQAEGEGEGSFGFRLPWRGRSRLRPGESRVFRFQAVATRSGERIGPAFELDSIFADARTTLHLFAAKLEEVRQTVARLEAMLPQLESFAAYPPEDYAGFRRRHTLLPPPGETPPLAIRVVVPCQGVTVRGLRRTLDSLARQSWPHWTAVVLPTDAEQQALAETVAARDPRVTWRDGLDSAGAEAEAARAGDAALLLPPGAMLAGDAALAWFAHAAAAHPGCAGFFCDEDSVEEVRFAPDRHADPIFRAALDPWELPRRNPCGEVLCARTGPALDRALAAAAGVADPAGRRWVAWAALAAEAPVGHIPRVLASIQRGALEAAAPAEAAPVEALRPLLRKPWLLEGAAEAPEAEGPITVIVPTRNGTDLVDVALGSLAGKAAEPKRLDLVVVDNGSDRPEALAWLDAGQRAGRFRLLRVDEPFNWSRLNNLAVAGTIIPPSGPEGLLLFLNDDTRMLTEGWDRILRRLLADPEAGAVGARLVYEDLTIQHAGVVFGVEGLAAHEGVGAAMAEEGPEGRWQRLRQAGGVTGAFLACRRAVFDRVGPFDEQALGVTFNDVDFCLAVRAASLAVLYAPEIALVHFESKSRGLDTLDPRKQERAEFERRKLEERWAGAALTRDPGFNPHWSRWTPPFAAIREPSAAEIAAHLALSATLNPWRIG